MCTGPKATEKSVNFRVRRLLSSSYVPSTMFNAFRHASMKSAKVNIWTGHKFQMYLQTLILLFKYSRVKEGTHQF